MDNYSTSFPTTTRVAPTSPTTTGTADASNANFESQQQMGFPQNPHFPSLRPFYPQTTFSPLQITQGYPTAYSQYFQPCNQTIPMPYANTFLPRNQPLVYPTYSTYSIDQNDVPCPMPNWQPHKMTLPHKIEEEKRKQKISREIRIQARQRLRISFANSASGSSSEAKTPNTIGSNVEDKAKLFNFQASNGKMVRELFEKKLRSSDVSSLGRIVIPKKVAETNLPILHDKEGIQILVKDVNSDEEWNLKFKYWSNNKSRMYVLENTGSLAKHYNLQSGDYMTLYEDELKNLYVSMRREERAQVAELSTSNKEDTYSYIHAPYKNEANDDEEEESLAILIEELKQNDTKGLNSLLNF